MPRSVKNTAGCSGQPNTRTDLGHVLLDHLDGPAKHRQHRASLRRRRRAWPCHNVHAVRRKPRTPAASQPAGNRHTSSIATSARRNPHANATLNSAWSRHACSEPLRPSRRAVSIRASHAAKNASSSSTRQRSPARVALELIQMRDQVALVKQLARTAAELPLADHRPRIAPITHILREARQPLLVGAQASSAPAVADAPTDPRRTRPHAKHATPTANSRHARRTRGPPPRSL